MSLNPLPWLLTDPVPPRDGATANAISTHTHARAAVSTRTQYPVLVVAFSCDLYSCDLFVLTQTLTMCELEPVPHWRESAHHIISVVVFLCGRQDPRGFSVWRSGIVALARACRPQWVVVVVVVVVWVGSVSPATFSHPRTTNSHPGALMPCLQGARL